MLIYYIISFQPLLASEKVPKGTQLAITRRWVFETAAFSSDGWPGTEANMKERLLPDHKHRITTLTVVTPHFSYLSMHYIGIQFFNHILLRQVFLAIPKKKGGREAQNQTHQRKGAAS